MRTSARVPARWLRPLEEFRRDLETVGRSPGGAAACVKHVRWLAKVGYEDPWQVSWADIDDWLTAQTWSWDTRRRTLKAVAAFYAWAAEAGRVTYSPMDGVCRHSTTGRGARAPVANAWGRAIDDHLTWMAAAGYARTTMRLKRHYLEMLARQTPDGPWTVTPEQLLDYLAPKHWRPETRKTARSSARSFYAWAAGAELVDVDPTRRLPRIRVPSGVPKPAPEDVVMQALARCGPRERLMVLLGATAGLRISEIAAVHTRDLTRRPDGAWLRILGKGGKTRMVPLSAPLDEDLLALPCGWVFPSQRRDHLTGGHVGQLLKRVLGENFTAHTLRHRFATVAYAADRDLLAVQQLLGHSRPETTSRYTALPDEALRTGAANAAIVEQPHPRPGLRVVPPNSEAG